MSNNGTRVARTLTNQGNDHIPDTISAAVGLASAISFKSDHQIYFDFSIS